ncbi:MAG: hypothetical protein HY731_01785, partial [Candidatus Tectomicrobia bacterium]|nr:hypothetical protein [Candidatus Tectomicrobia bacterium]
MILLPPWWGKVGMGGEEPGGFLLLIIITIVIIVVIILAGDTLMRVHRLGQIFGQHEVCVRGLGKQQDDAEAITTRPSVSLPVSNVKLFTNKMDLAFKSGRQTVVGIGQCEAYAKHATRRIDHAVYHCHLRRVHAVHRCF